MEDLDDTFELEEDTKAPKPPSPVKKGGWGDISSPPVKKGGWGDGPVSNSTEAAEAIPEPKEIKFGRRRGGNQNDTKGRGEVEDTIVDLDMIPDAEEETKEDITTQIADAPHVKAAKVQSLRDLNNDLDFNIALGQKDGIDLSLLTSFLIPKEVIDMEVDELWEFDVLYSDLQSELNAENDQDEEEEKKEGE